MKLKLHRPRSCLGWFAWAFGVLLLIFALGNVYAQVRMAQVTRDIASLAHELGYTPEEHLHHRITVRDVSIITGSAYCVAKLYYSTPMKLAEFTERLNQLEPETKELRLQNMILGLSGLVPGLTVDGTNSQTSPPTSRREPPMMYRWPLDKGYEINIELYDTTNLNAAVKHEGKQVKGNIVQIYAEGGIFPIWVHCPATFSDAPAPPFN